MNPFNLPGPQFLVLYGCLFVVATALAVVLRLVLRPPHDEPKFDLDKLKPYMVAYLAGGARGALAAAMANLVQTDVLKVGMASGDVSQSGTLPDDSHPVEDFVFENVANVRDMKASWCEKQPCFQEIRRAMIGLGLLLTPSRERTIAVCSTLGLFLLAIFGAIKVGIGLWRGRPLIFLVLAALATAIVGVVFFALRPIRTGRGDRALSAIKAENAALKATAKTNGDELAPDDLILAAGLFGVAAVTLPSLVDYQRAMARNMGGSDGGGSWSSCSSGGCGGGGCGGGCGGGGCGGCS